MCCDPTFLCWGIANIVKRHHLFSLFMTLKMKCHTKHLYIQFSTYSHQPLFIGGMRNPKLGQKVHLITPTTSTKGLFKTCLKDNVDGGGVYGTPCKSSPQAHSCKDRLSSEGISLQQNYPTKQHLHTQTINHMSLTGTHCNLVYNCT